MKTLDQIKARTPIGSLPYVITNSGAYYRTDTRRGGTSVTGITINASAVTLDLNGFALVGGSGSYHGIFVGGTASAPCTDVVIQNGIVRDWGQSGVYGVVRRARAYQPLDREQQRGQRSLS